jgi:hypothetical protein
VIALLTLQLACRIQPAGACMLIASLALTAQPHRMRLFSAADVVQSKSHPQTIAVCQMRADGLGLVAC